MDTDVVVVGAGLAGLRCAAELESAGLSVLTLEASEAAGGRIRTDRVDDFLCDRGFQLLNPAYPAVRRHVDCAALGLQSFDAGVAIRREDGPGRGAGGLAVVADPRRAPRLLPRSLASGLVRPGELAALARLLGPALAAPQRMLRRDDSTLREALDRAGVDGPLRREVLEPFLAGVLADSTGTTSAHFVRLLIRTFVVGTPGLPARGMQALPEQLATRLATPVLLGVGVEAVHEAGSGVEVRTTAGRHRARAAVVAVGPGDVDSLVPGVRPPTGGLVTWWFAAAEAPYDRALLTLDARPGGGPVQHAAVVSKAAPSYAPQGRHLVQATAVSDRSPDATEADVRRQLAGVWDTDTSAWELLIRHDIPHALPFQAAPLRVHAEARVGDRTYLAGDHRDTASIQGAMVSGARVARSLLADLGAGR